MSTRWDFLFFFICSTRINEDKDAAIRWLGLCTTRRGRITSNRCLAKFHHQPNTSRLVMIVFVNYGHCHDGCTCVTAPCIQGENELKVAWHHFRSIVTNFQIIGWMHGHKCDTDKPYKYLISILSSTMLLVIDPVTRYHTHFFCQTCSLQHLSISLALKCCVILNNFVRSHFAYLLFISCQTSTVMSECNCELELSDVSRKKPCNAFLKSFVPFAPP